jgi:hypothetical protein
VPEKLTFHFEGSLADSHKMNFYEAARFQYAASRLLVKLARFRVRGTFPQKISKKSNVEVNLTSQADGSFNINVEDQGQTEKGQFLDMSLSDLVAFVSERVIEKINGEALQERHTAPPSPSAPDQLEFTENIENLSHAIVEGKIRLKDIPTEVHHLIRRRVAEIHRELRLSHIPKDIEKITPDREQKLIAMAAPLLSEMATALRKSAETLEVSSSTDGTSRTVLFLDEKMAAEIETAKVDSEAITLLGDVIQFNKDNGWGKLRFDAGTNIVSFSIPYDILPIIKQRLIDTMKSDQVYLRVHPVRDRANEIIRLIVTGILDTPET